MGRREVTTTTTRAVRTCDLCGRDAVGYEPTRCRVCGREVCFGCGRVVTTHGPDDAVLLTLYVCLGCEESGGPSIPALRAALARCNDLVDAVLSQWREQSRGME